MPFYDVNSYKQMFVYATPLLAEIAFFDEHKSGELVSRLGSDTTLLQSVVSQSLPDFCTQTIKAIVAMILMFYLSVKLAGLALGGAVLIFLLSAPMGKLMGQLSKQYVSNGCGFDIFHLYLFCRALTNSNAGGI